MLMCKRGLEVKPQYCNAGWYLGTWDDEGPRCRLSLAYAKTKEEATRLPIDRCNADENRFCAGCAGCGITEV